MGYTRTAGMLECVEMGIVDLDAVLTDHLQCNHYPPVSLVFLGTARNAIAMANREEWEEPITMPNGKTLTVAQIVDGLHLDAFVEYGQGGEL